MSERTGFTIVLFFDIPTRPGTVTWQTLWRPTFTFHEAQAQAEEYSTNGVWVEVPGPEGLGVTLLVPWHHIRQVWIMKGEPSAQAVDGLITAMWDSVPIYPPERRPKPSVTDSLTVS